MSHDFDVVCDVCKTYRHLGQEMAVRWSFGYGPNNADGRLFAGEFIVRHLYHDDRSPRRHGRNPDGTEKSTCGAESLRIVPSDDVPDGYTEEED